MSRSLRSFLLLFVAFVAFAAAWRSAVAPALATTPAAAMDFLPLWLGAGLVDAGEDPNDPVAAAAQFREEKLPLHPGGFYNYYPPTAPLFVLPLRPLGFRLAVTLWRIVGVLGIAGGAALAVLAGFRGRLTPPAAGFALLIAAFVLLTRPARVVLPTGQPGPLVVGLTGLAFWLLARERTRSAAIAAALGVAVKLVPVILLPVFLVRRQWGACFGFLGTLAMLLLVLLGFGVPLDPVGWAGGLVGFVSREPLPSWGNQPWLLALWRVRVPLVSVGSLLVIGQLWRRPRTEVALHVAAALVAAVGVIMAGTHHYHEALVLVPALAHGLAWPAQEPRSRLAWVAGLGLLLVCAAAPGALQRGGRPDSLVWVGLGTVIWFVSVVRVLVSPAAPPTSASSSPPAPLPTPR